VFRSPSPAPDRRPLADIAALAVSVAGMAVAGPLVNDISGVGSLAIALWRNLIAVLVVVPVLLWRHRRRPPHLQWRDLVGSVTAGLLFALYLGLWIPSLHFTNVASSTGLSFAVAPIWVLVIRHIRGERQPGTVWAGTLLAVTGVLVLAGVDVMLSARHLAGDLLALASGIAVAGYLVIGAQTRRRVDTTIFTTVCYGSAAAALLIACLVTATPISGYSARSWGKIALLTLSVQLVGHSLNCRAVKTLGIAITSTAILLETPGATLIEGLWHHTWPGPPAQAALLTVLAGMAIVVRVSPSPRATAPTPGWSARLHRSRRTSAPYPPPTRQVPQPPRPYYRSALATTAVAVAAIAVLGHQQRHRLHGLLLPHPGAARRQRTAKGPIS
jgi:drug/metabolite transporter (DMT)-like permease